MFPVFIMTYVRPPNPSIAADIGTPFYYTEIGSSLFFICVHMCTNMCFCVFLLTTHLAPPVSDPFLITDWKYQLYNPYSVMERQTSCNAQGIVKGKDKDWEVKRQNKVISLRLWKIAGYFFSCFFSVFVLFAIILFLSSSLWILRAALNPWTWIRT